LFKESGIDFGGFCGTLKFWKNMDFDDVNTSSTICTWDTWYRMCRKKNIYIYGAKPSPPDWVSKIYRGVKSQTWVKNGGSKFPTLARTYFEGGSVLSKKWSPTIINNKDLSSYIRFGIWGEDFMLRSPHLSALFDEKSFKNWKFWKFLKLI